MLKTLGENIIFKLQVKNTVAGIIVERDTKTADKKFIDKAFVYLVGDKITSVKPGQEVILSGRPMYPLDIEKYIDEEKDENIMYAKGKEEDIIAVIQ